MTEDLITIVERTYEAFNRRDAEAFLSDYAEDAVVRPFATPLSVYRGHDGIRRWFADNAEAWGEVAVTRERYFQRGDRVLVFVRMHGRGLQSGAEVDTSAAHVIEHRDGKLTSMTGYRDREEAMRVAGIDSIAD